MIPSFSSTRKLSALVVGFLLTATVWAQAPQPCKVELFIGDPDFFSGDGGPAINAKLWTLTGLEIGSNGSIYFSDSVNNRIRRIDPQGAVTTIAGTGAAGIDGEGGPAVAAQLSQPTALALAPNGTIYFLDDNGRRVRRITSGGFVQSVEFVPRGDARYIAISGDGDVYYSRGPEGVFRIVSDGVSERFAGGGVLTADGVDALDFDFESAGDLLVSSKGDVLVADGVRVFAIAQDGTIRTLLGGGSTMFNQGVAPLNLDLGVAFGLGETTDGAILVNSSRGVFSLKEGVVTRRSELQLSVMASGEGGTVFAKSLSNQIVRLLDNNSIQTVAGVDMAPFYEPGRALDQTLIFSARGLQSDSQGRLYYFDQGRSRLFRTTLDGKIEVFAGGGQQQPANGVPALEALLFQIGDTTIDETDRVSFSVRGGAGSPPLVLRVEPTGTLTVIAGGGQVADPLSDQLPASSINFNNRAPAIAAKAGGSIYFSLRDRIYEVGADGVAHLVFNFSGSTPSQLRSDPSGGVLVVAGSIYLFKDSVSAPIVVDPNQGPAQAFRFGDESLFLIDQIGRSVRIRPDGRITDYISRGSGFSFSAGRLDLNAGLAFPLAATVSRQGDLFIADHGLSRIFVIRDADTCTLDRPFIAATVHGASFNGASTAPGTIASAFGQDLGSDVLSYGAPGQSPNGTWQTSVGGLEVLVDGQPAPIIFSRTDQAAFVYPNGIRDAFRLQVRRNGLLSSSFLNAPVPNASPGLFTVNSSGSGQAAALNQDSSINSPGNPAAPGSVIVLYLTGAGATNPPSVTGSLNDFPLPQLVEPVEVTINGANAVVEFAGPAPGLISGVVQVNARIPADAPSGAVSVTVTIGGVESPTGPSGQPVTISIQ